MGKGKVKHKEKNDGKCNNCGGAGRYSATARRRSGLAWRMLTAIVASAEDTTRLYPTDSPNVESNGKGQDSKRSWAKVAEQKSCGKGGGKGQKQRGKEVKRGLDEINIMSRP